MEDTAFSARIEALDDGTVVAERAMWWPGDGLSWHEGHVSAGAPAAGTAWVVAQGRDGGPNNEETFVLVGNVGDADATVRVDVIAEDGTTASVTIPVASHSRANLAMRQLFPTMRGKRFGVLITSIGTEAAELVVEGSTYGDVGATRWESGASAPGTRLR